MKLQVIATTHQGEKIEFRELCGRAGKSSTYEFWSEQEKHRKKRRKMRR